jgi:hypothetical protein
MISQPIRMSPYGIGSVITRNTKMLAVDLRINIINVRAMIGVT